MFSVLYYQHFNFEFSFQRKDPIRGIYPILEALLINWPEVLYQWVGIPLGPNQVIERPILIFIIVLFHHLVQYNLQSLSVVKLL